MSLNDELLSQTHKFLMQNQYPGDPAFCRTVAAVAERLIRRGKLKPQSLANSIRLPASYRRGHIRKRSFAEQVVASIRPLAASFRNEIRSEVQEFMASLKHYLRRHVAKKIYCKG